MKDTEHLQPSVSGPDRPLAPVPPKEKQPGHVNKRLGEEPREKDPIDMAAEESEENQRTPDSDVEIQAEELMQSMRLTSKWPAVTRDYIVLSCSSRLFVRRPSLRSP